LRPRQETNTNSGGTGFRVRIIPSTQALGGARTQDSAVFDEAADETDPKRGSQGGVFDQPRRAPAPPQSSRPVDEEPYEVTPARPSGAPPVLRRSGEPEPAEPAAPSSYGATSAPAGEEAIRLNASLVNLNVMVTDRAGKALPGLKKEDFQVSENGESQSIEFFAPSSAPFNLVLLLDLSGSIQDKLDVVKSAALRFLDTVGPQDRVAVVTFSQRVRVVSQLTNNHDLVRERIKTIDRPVGGTAFYEAMWFALADTLRGTEGQRNAIVAMTDGVDSSLDRYDPAPTRVTFNRLHGRLEESDVIVFPIYLDTEYEEVFERGNGTSEAYAIARSQLEKIAEATGGQIFHAEQVKDLAGVYKQVAAALRTVYSVGYYSTKPERDGTYRRVHVGVSRGGAAVRTRRGYYAK
jgi:VWFA-related protein